MTGGGSGMDTGFAHLRGAAGFLRTVEWEAAGLPHLLGIREHSFALYAGAGAAVHFDLEGRLRRAFFEEPGAWVHYLRGFDGKLLVKRRARRGERGGAAPENSASGRESRRCTSRSRDKPARAD